MHTHNIFLTMKCTSFFKDSNVSSCCNLKKQTKVSFSIFIHPIKTSHINKHHETPSQASDQKHGHMHAVYEQIIENPEVESTVTQQEEDDGQLVLKAKENPHADVLKTEERRQRHPEEGGKEAAAEIQEEPDETIHPSRLQVQVKVVVFGAYELGGAGRAAGGVHAGGVRAVEGANPPRDGNDRHG